MSILICLKILFIAVLLLSNKDKTKKSFFIKKEQ